MDKDVERVLFSEGKIARRVAALGREVARRYAGKDLVMVCILKGASVFFADLIRAAKLPAEIDFMSVSSYGAGSESSGSVRILKDVSAPVAGRHVLLVEDIIDTGNSLFALKKLFAERGAASVGICAFLDKKARRRAPVEADIYGFAVEDAFVVGYGLDYAERYRALPYIGVLKREIYEK